jgi:hypothetical protein
LAFSSKKEDFNDVQEDLVEDKMKETPYVLPKIGRKYKNNQVTDKDANLENQSKKKHKKGGSNLESVIQKWFEQQEARQKELDRKKEEKKKNKNKRQNYFI